MRFPVGRFMSFLVLSSLCCVAVAGRDEGQIEMLDKADKAAAAQALARSVEEQRRYLPLDHGPHAAATAWSNRRTLALRTEQQRSSYATAIAPKE